MSHIPTSQTEFDEAIDEIVQVNRRMEEDPLEVARTVVTAMKQVGDELTVDGTAEPFLEQPMDPMNVIRTRPDYSTVRIRRYAYDVAVRIVRDEIERRQTARVPEVIR